MAQPTTITQAVQLGIQPDGDTAVAADKRLLAFGITINPEQEYDTFVPSGMKYATIVSITKDWAGGAVDGRMTYDEMTFLLASVLTKPVHVGDETTGSTWTFSPSTTEVDDPLIMTVERGSSIVAQRAKGAVISELTLTTDRNGGCTLSGSVLGQRLDLIPSMTPDPVSVSPGPFAIQPNQVDIFIDVGTHADIGTTNLCNCNVAELKIASRYGPWWVLCSREISYADVVETQPDVTMTLTMVADETGLGFLDNARAGDTVYIRMQATGPDLPGVVPATPMMFQFDFCGKINAVPSMGDTDGVVTAGWQFAAIHDPNWGRAMQGKLINALPVTALDPGAAAPLKGIDDQQLARSVVTTETEPAPAA